MIGDVKFQVVSAADHYRLSDGTELRFLTRENSDGLTNEELVGVLLHRLRIQNKQAPCKETSRAVTLLEQFEEVLWARDIRRRQDKRERQGVTFGSANASDNETIKAWMRGSEEVPT